MGLCLVFAGGAVSVEQPVGILTHAQHVCEVEEHDFTSKPETGGDEVRGIVVRAIPHFVGRGFQPVAGAEGKSLRDVDLTAHAESVRNSVFRADGIIFVNVVVVVVIEGGLAVVFELILGGDEGALGDEERGVDIEFQRGGQRGGSIVVVGIFTASAV